MKKKLTLSAGAVVVLLIFSAMANAAYHHMGESDSDKFLAVYPEKAGTKLDSCNLCHSGGQYLNSKGVLVSLGSCQWCHFTYGYDGSGNIDDTLNQYGRDFRDFGRNESALTAIQDRDSDGDRYSNIDEIIAVRYPGDSNDDPTKVPAPYRIYSRDQLEMMPAHTQFMLMNTHKSDDFYAEYTGIPVENLLQNAGVLNTATGLIVYAPDGWSQYHPLNFDPDPLLYHVYGSYPQASYYYDEEADLFKTSYGWCNYSAPSNEGRQNGDMIQNEDGLKPILAFLRDGEYLNAGQLTLDNKLDGEGPFRLVPPQKTPGPPDQKSTAANQDVIWPFDNSADHNAGYSTRTVTMIKVEPLPEGTTDVDTLEYGWNFVDENKILVYGAIDPIPNVKEKLVELTQTIQSLDREAFKQPVFKVQLEKQTEIVRMQVNKGNYNAAFNILNNHIMNKIDGCVEAGSSENNDWITDCTAQKKVYWPAHEITILMNIALTGKY